MVAAGFPRQKKLFFQRDVVAREIRAPGRFAFQNLGILRYGHAVRCAQIVVKAFNFAGLITSRISIRDVFRDDFLAIRQPFQPVRCQLK